jgi:leader peptidase (prepilin peptidase)/N-methyltransferase
VAIASPANPTTAPHTLPTRVWAVVTLVVAALTGTALALTGPPHSWPTGIAAGASLIATIWVTTTDTRHRIIPNTTTLLLATLYATTAVLALITGTITWTDLARTATATGIMAALQITLYLTGATSPGDVKLATALMISTALISWPAALAAAVLPYVLALPEAVVKILRRKQHAGIAFGPYLALSTTIVLIASLILGQP